MAKYHVNSCFACRLCNIIGPHKVDIFDGDSRELRDSISELYDVQVQRNNKSTKICTKCLEEINNFKLMRKVCAETNRRMKKTVPNGGDVSSGLAVVPADATKTTQNASSPQSVRARPSVIVSASNVIDLTTDDDPDPHAMDSASKPCADDRTNDNRKFAVARATALLTATVDLIVDETDGKKIPPNQAGDGSCVLTPMAPNTDQHLTSSRPAVTEPSLHSSMECEEIIVDDTESSSIHSPDEYMSSLEYESETDIEAIEGANRDRDRDIATSMPSTSAEPAPHYNTDTDRPYFCELSPTSSGVLKLVLRRSAINCSLRRSVRHKPWMIMSNTSTSTPPTDEIDSNEKLPPKDPPKKRMESFCCYKCKQIFSQRKSLKRHLKAKHFDRKRFQCKLCSKSFVQSGPLGKHMNAAHTKKTKYKCEKCPEFFYYREYLTYHLASKHGVGVYRCDVCNKICTTKQHLQNHMSSKSHSNEKSLQCPIKSCSRKFTQTSSLTIHIKTKHG